MKFQYECPKCFDEIEVEGGDNETTCPSCKARLAMHWDAEFTEGRWRDLTQVREIERQVI